MNHFDDQESKGKRNVSNKKDNWKNKGKRQEGKRQEGTRKGTEGRINDKSNMKKMEFRIGFRINLHLVLNDNKMETQKEKEQETKEDANRKHLNGIQN